MSHLGKKPLFSPSAIQFHQKADLLIITNQKTKAALKIKIGIPLRISLQKKADGSQNKIQLFLAPEKQSPRNKSCWGTLRAQLWNTLQGLFKIHSLKLEFIGVGYRAVFKKRILILRLGLSHKMFAQIPQSVQITKVKKRPPTFLLRSIDLDMVRSTAFLLRSFKKPEPYKGKGILLTNEIVKLKESKKTKNG